MPLLGFNKSNAYLVGISRYAYPIKELSTPVKDIYAIGSILHDFDSVTKKTDLSSSEFDSFLKELVTEVNNSKTDRVLFYFAGHGTTINNTRGPQGFLILKNDSSDENSGNYKIEDLLTHLSQLTCKHLLIILDCCFAGAVQWDISKRGAGRKNEEKITDPLYRIFAGNNAWQIITSAAANQEALNAYNSPVKKMWGDGLRNEESDNSPFAIQFINALKGVGKDDFFAEKVITANRLYTYITENLIKDLQDKEINHEQVPGLFSLLKHKNGQFIFSFKNEEPVFAKTPEFENPYRGFDSYTENDSGLFFGRDKLISDFKKHIGQFNNFFISGPSGIGKSSLVKAGFVSRLLSINDKTSYHSFRPATFDFANTWSWLQKLGSDKSYILFFDQFEEAISIGEEKQKQLADIINAAIASPAIYLFVAIRSDKAKKILGNPLFNWQRFKEISISFPDSGDIEDIIVKPALRLATLIKAETNEDKGQQEQDIKADEVFINAIVKDYDQPGSLPFLSTALHEWFKSVNAQNNPRLLKQSSWNKAGSIEEVFSAKMARIEARVADPYVFRRLMFRLLDYFEDTPVRKRLARKFTQPGDAPLLKILEEERIIRYPDDRPDNHPNRLIEFAHDSIIEKWLQQQTWFIERVTKAKGNIAALVRAQNQLVPAAIIWQQACEKKGIINKLKANRKLWEKEEGLLKVKRDIEKTPTYNESNWQQVKNTFFSLKALDVPKKTYFTATEMDFIIQSVRRKRLRAKIFHRISIVVGLLAVVILLLIYQANLEANRKVKENLARSYAEQSTNVGEIEALFLLKEAEKLNPKDSFIEAKFSQLLNERDYAGNPFAIAATNIKSGLLNVHWDSVQNRMLLYTDVKDTLLWNYTGEKEPENNMANTDIIKIKKIKLVNNTLFLESNRTDSILFKGENINNYGFSKRNDWLYIITRIDKDGGPYLPVSKLYAYSLHTKKSYLVIEKVSRNGIDILTFSPKKNYVYIKTDQRINFYSLSGAPACTIVNTCTDWGQVVFNEQEDKVLIESLTYDNGLVLKNSLDLCDFKLNISHKLPHVSKALDGNFLFKNDTSVIYFTGVIDSARIIYREYNINSQQASAEKTVHVPKGSYSLGALVAATNYNNLVLVDVVDKKFIAGDSLGYTMLNYEGEYSGHAIIQNGASTLLLVRSTRSGLHLTTVYHVTRTPVLLHKSSFSLRLKTAFCIGNLSMLLLEFDNGLLAAFDLAENLKITKQVELQPYSTFQGFIEIDSRSFAIFTNHKIFFTGANLAFTKLDLATIRNKAEYLLCQPYDKSLRSYKDSIFLFNCKTGQLTTVNSEEDKLNALKVLSGFDLNKIQDSIFINIPGKVPQKIYSPEVFDDYFTSLSKPVNYYFRFPNYVKTSTYNLSVYTPVQTYQFNKTEGPNPAYTAFSNIDMPADSIVTGIVFEYAVQKRRFFYWNLNTDQKDFLDCPCSPFDCPYFAIPKTTQILFAYNSSIFIYDFKKRGIIYSGTRANTIKKLFLLNDGLRFISVDANANIYSEFLPQRTKEFADKIKSPRLEYLKKN